MAIDLGVIRRFVCLAATGLAVAAVASTTGQAKEVVAAVGEVAYTRVWIDPALGDRTWITVADLAGNQQHDITHRPAKATPFDDYGPIWSPDGSWLAFLRLGRNGSSSGLYVASRDGAQVRRVLPVPKDVFDTADPSDYYLSAEAPSYAWSPDGQRLAFADGPLYVVNRDGTNRRRLVAASTCKPAWSPNNQSIVYLVDNSCGGRGANQSAPGHRAVARIDVDGAHKQQLATGSFGDATWSSDGQRIAVTDDCDVQHGGDWLCSVSLMNADGTGKRTLVKNSYGGWTEWAASGRELLWPKYPTFLATNVASGKARQALPASNRAGYPIGESQDGQLIAVIAADSYSIAHSAHPSPPIIIVSSGAQLVQRVTVPPGWQARDAKVWVR